MNKVWAAVIAIFVLGFCYTAHELVCWQERREATWMKFQQDHHCRLKSSSFWDETYWACDGFDVRHD